MNKRTPNDFTSALEAIRAERQATLKELAKDLGLSMSYLHELEKGTRNPSVKNVRSIIQFLRAQNGRVSEEYWHKLAARTHGWKV